MSRADEVSVTTTPDILQALRESVAAGEYASTSEALNDAVRLWRQRRLEDSERLKAIRSRILGSLEDPRPSLTEAELDARLNELLEEPARTRG